MLFSEISVLLCKSVVQIIAVIAIIASECVRFQLSACFRIVGRDHIPPLIALSDQIINLKIFHYKDRR